LLQHQGWNDACRAGGADPAHYEKDLANLIRDLRKDLKAPEMKVVVGTSGMCGFPQDKYKQKYQHCAGACATLADPIIPAQLAVGDATKYPEFKGNVASVETRGFHYDMEESAGNQCYVRPPPISSSPLVPLTCAYGGGGAALEQQRTIILAHGPSPGEGLPPAALS
jgi:hypothetical protein